MYRGKSSHKQDQFLAALLTHPTVAMAAQKAGISEATATRWLADSSFDARYRAARKQALGETLAYLQQTMLEAVMTLRVVMLDPNARPSTRVLAASKILEIGFRAVEFERIDQRLEALAAGMEDLKACARLNS